MSEDLPLLGFGLPVAGAPATPEAMTRVARLAEDLGYASLWTFQRLLSPVTDQTGTDPAEHDDFGDFGDYEAHNPGSRAAADPTYHAVHDAVVPLAFVASQTRRIRLGTATICAPFQPPFVLAKALASLDQVSGGRLDVGLGIGWLPQEYAAAGVPMAQRGARMEEYLRCLVALWTEDPVAFAGEFYTVPRSHVGPKPVQHPHPPLLIGGAAPAALRRAGRLTQGWISSSRHDLDHVADAVALVRDGARDAGRDPGLVRIVVRAVVDLQDSPAGPGRARFHGSVAQVRDDLAALHAQGVTEVFVDPNVAGQPEQTWAGAEDVMHALAPAQLSG